MILVVGATGTTGRDAVAKLVERGAKVRAMSRDPDKARALPGFAGVEVVSGDPALPETLDAAFSGVDKVLLIPPSGPGWNQSEQNLIDAARRAGVKHVVKLSVLLADPGAPSLTLSYHAQGEKSLAAAGIPSTMLRASSFMQNFVVYYAPTIRSDGAVYQCTGDALMAMIDTRDVAEVAAVVLLAPTEEHMGKVYDLTGPEALNYSAAAQKLSAATGRPVRYVDIPPDAYEQALLAAQLPAWTAAEIVNVYGRGPYHEGRGGQVTSTVAEILGRPGRSFDDFAREHTDQF